MIKINAIDQTLTVNEKKYNCFFDIKLLQEEDLIVCRNDINKFNIFDMKKKCFIIEKWIYFVEPSSYKRYGFLRAVQIDYSTGIFIDNDIRRRYKENFLYKGIWVYGEW